MNALSAICPTVYYTFAGKTRVAGSPEPAMA